MFVQLRGWWAAGVDTKAMSRKKLRGQVGDSFVIAISLTTEWLARQDDLLHSSFIYDVGSEVH